MIVYGHEALDQAILKHGLSYAGGMWTAAEARTILTDLVPAWYANVEPAYGYVKFCAARSHVRSGVQLPGGALTGSAELAEDTLAAVDALAGLFTGDQVRIAEFGPDDAGPPLQVVCTTAATTRNAELRMDEGLDIAVVSITSPTWMSPGYWSAARPRDRQTLTTVDYWQMRSAVELAWLQKGRLGVVGDPPLLEEISRQAQLAGQKQRGDATQQDGGRE